MWPCYVVVQALQHNAFSKPDLALWFLLKILAHRNVKTVSQVCAVYIGCFSTFSGSTFAEEFKSEVGARKNTRQRALRHILRHFFPNFGPSCPIWVCEDIFW